VWQLTPKSVAYTTRSLKNLAHLTYDRFGEMIECVENKEEAMKLINFDHSFSIYKPTYEEVCAASTICPNITELKVKKSIKVLRIFVGIYGSSLFFVLHVLREKSLNLNLIFRFYSKRFSCSGVSNISIKC
jgi:hypothetical protein